MDQNTKISVVMPCYNSENTLSDQLDALLRQTYKGRWELIIADNGSEDSTLEIAKNYKDHFYSFKIIKANKIKGPAYARNCGVEVAEGDSILFCDSDDVVENSWMEYMIKALSEYEIVAPKMEHFEISENSRYAIQRVFMQSKKLINSGFDPPLPHAGASGLGIRKSLHVKIGGFDEDFFAAEDWDYCWKAQLAGSQLKFEKKALIHIRHKSSLSDFLKQSYTWGKYYELIIKKYKPLGITPPNFNKKLIVWKKILKHLNQKKYRDKFLYKIFNSLGKLQGYIKFKLYHLS